MYGLLGPQQKLSEVQEMLLGKRQHYSAAFLDRSFSLVIRKQNVSFCLSYYEQGTVLGCLCGRYAETAVVTAAVGYRAYPKMKASAEQNRHGYR